MESLKERFYSLYLNQDVLYTPRLVWVGNPPEPEREEWVEDTLTLDNIKLIIEHGFPLFLKPLSAISDEDALKVLEILGEYKPKPFDISHHEERDRKWTRISRQYKDLLGNDEIKILFNCSSDGTIRHYKNIRSEDCAHLYDYLRSKGYAVPFMGISVEKLINKEWIICETIPAE